jgi:hypothetical protein
MRSLTRNKRIPQVLVVAGILSVAAAVTSGPTPLPLAILGWVGYFVMLAGLIWSIALSLRSRDKQ